MSFDPPLTSTSPGPTNPPAIRGGRRGMIMAAALAMATLGGGYAPTRPERDEPDEDPPAKPPEPVPATPAKPDPLSIGEQIIVASPLRAPESGTVKRIEGRRRMIHIEFEEFGHGFTRFNEVVDMQRANGESGKVAVWSSKGRNVQFKLLPQSAKPPAPVTEIDPSDEVLMSTGE